MQRTFLTNLIFLVFLNLAVKPFWILGVDRAVQNQVGAEAYGSYFALFNLSLILNILLDLGITNFNNRNISRHSHLLGKYFASIVSLRLLLAIGYSVICMAVGLILGYDTPKLLMLSVLCANQFMLTFILFLRSNISGLQLFRLDSMLSVLDRLLMILGCGALLLGFIGNGTISIWTFVWIQSAAYALTIGIALWAVLHHGGPFRWRFDRKVFPTILRQSLPFAVLILLMSIYGRIDSVLLERLLPDGDLQAGIYAQSFRLLDSAAMVGFLFAGLLLPMFSKMLKDREDIRPLAALSSKMLLIPAFALGLVGVLHARPLMELLYTEYTLESARVLSVMLFSFLPMAGTYVFGTLLTAHGDLLKLNIVAAGGMALNLVLNFILIPRYGPQGAAISCLSTQGLTFVLQWLLAIRLFGFRYNPSRVIEFAIPGSLILLSALATADMPWLTATLIILSVAGLSTIAVIRRELAALIRRI